MRRIISIYANLLYVEANNMIFEKGQKELVIGDSISDFDRARPVGEGLFNAWGTSYVADVGALLTSVYPELGLRIVNMGISAAIPCAI